MTSELSVERAGEQEFLHCLCGAAIQAQEKKQTCPDCGETIEILRWVATSHGKKCKLRFSNHKHTHSTGPNTGLRRWGFAASPEKPGVAEPVDWNRRCFRLGLLILLAPLYLPPLLGVLRTMSAPAIVEQSRSSEKMIVMPMPDDCGLFSGCHYKEHARYDARTGYTVVTWERVAD
jgi:predicted RNA-binding Zn-ribbon protein involved in translation (DUF1610 family)